jgi:signal transduction histidine kinase
MPLKFFKRVAISSNISTYLSHTLIIITVATTLLIGGVLIIQQTMFFSKISQQRSKEYVADQKIYIQEIVKNELEYIRLQNIAFKQRIKSKIKSNVYQAISIAESIYEQYAGKKTDEEIKVLIITAVSSLKFNMEFEEVFISTMGGVGVYYPKKPEFTGKYLLKFKDANGLPVIQEEINLLKNNAEGYLDYNINLELDTEKSPNKKITFVKKFSQYNWYFGSKQYVDDFFPEFRNEIAEKIGTVRFRHGGYIFMNHVNGTPIVMDGKVYKGNINFLEDTNNVRNPFFLQQQDIAKNSPDGGFFYYKWNKIDEPTPIDKCSYIQLFKDYGWIVGAGFYMDEIEDTIKEQQASLRRDQQKSIMTIVFILICLLVLEAIIIYHFNKRYKADFERFFNFFFLSQHSFNKLNIKKFYFDEFKKAGEAANEMIALREEIQDKLIDEQKKAMEADRLKSAFLANMSHEIRTPMNAILGFSELLEDETHDEADKTVFVSLIRRNGDILLSLINDIIDISKIEANLLSVRKRPVLLNKFLNEINEHYTETLALKKDKKIQFRMNAIENQTISIQTDESRLRQILDNLIGNAIKFTSNNGSVSLDVNIQGDRVHFSITDTGIGIPAEQQASIFERFIQANEGHKMNFGGTGLGLAISKNLIELLGGNIGVESELGKGSKFYFSIQTN